MWQYLVLTTIFGLTILSSVNHGEAQLGPLIPDYDEIMEFLAGKTKILLLLTL